MQYAIKKICKSMILWLAVAVIIVLAVRCMPDEISVSNNVGGRELPIYCVDTQERKIALSFDAAWGNEDTEQILDILEKYGVKATFFMTGGWVEEYPEDVKRIYEAGHELGNHSENHRHMSQLSEEEQKEELMQVHDKVKAITGVDMCVFRPPYGDYDDSVVITALECGYYPIQWSVDTLRTKVKKIYFKTL